MSRYSNDFRSCYKDTESISPALTITNNTASSTQTPRILNASANLRDPSDLSGPSCSTNDTASTTENRNGKTFYPADLLSSGDESEPLVDSESTYHPSDSAESNTEESDKQSGDEYNQLAGITVNPHATATNYETTDDLFDLVVRETNRYADQYIRSHDLCRRSEVRKWIATNAKEIRTFLESS